MSKTFTELYQEFAEELTDAPAKFHEFMAYAIVGVLLGRNVSFPFGGQTIYPNFYMVLIAPSSMYRKSTALSIASKVIKKAQNPTDRKILPSEFSHEKLVEILQTSPSGAFVFYEFQTLMGLLDKDYMAGTKAFLTELYDNPDEYIRRTKKEDIQILNPNISILSATTQKWFTATKGDTEGGFLNRFLFVPAATKEKSMPIPPAIDTEKLNTLKFVLQDLMKFCDIKDGRRMEISADAREMYINWYNSSCKLIELQGDDDSGFCASATRMQTYLIKFAMLIAIIDNRSDVISYDNLLKAIKLVQWLTLQTENILKNEIHEGKFDKQIHKIKSVLTKNGGSCDWGRLLKYSHLNSREFMENIKTLEDRGEIERKMSKDSKGLGIVSLIKD
jgi:hypothetical protein